MQDQALTPTDESNAATAAKQRDDDDYDQCKKYKTGSSRILHM